MNTERYTPELRLAIDGEPVPAALRAAVTSVSLQRGLEGVDRVELGLANEGLRWLDYPMLALDRDLTLFLGYAPDPLVQMFSGEIVGQSASFPSSGMPALTVVAQDRRYRMQRGNASRWFAIAVPKTTNLPLPDVAVAGALSAGHGLIPIVDPVAGALAVLIGGASALAAVADKDVQKVIRKQSGESDYDLLAKLCVENGWDMTVDHGGALGGRVLRFSSAADRLQPDVTLKYGRDLIEFSPRVSTVGQVVGVSAHIWQPDLKMSFAISVGWDWDRQSLELRIVPGGAEAAPQVDKAQFMLLDKPLTRTNAARTLMGTLLPRLNKRLTGSGSTVGDPRIEPGGVLRLEGLGEKFGGLYRVTSVTQTLDSGGWRTSFEVRKEIWFAAIATAEQGAVAVPMALRGPA